MINCFAMICSYFLEYFVIFFKFEIDKLRETDVILLFMIILSEHFNAVFTKVPRNSTDIFS